MIAAAGHRRSRSLAYAVVPLIFVAALATAGLIAAGGDSLEFRWALKPLLLAMTPFALYFAWRYPLVFPFGLYLMLLPYDNLTGASTNGATISRLLAIASGVALVLNALARRQVLAPQRAWYWWAAVVGWMGITALWSVDPTQSGIVLAQMAQLLLLFTVLAMYPARPGEARMVLGMVVVSYTISGAYALYQYLSGAAYHGRVSLVTGEGLVADPNHYAANFLLPIGITLAGVLTVRRPSARIALAGVLLLLVTAVLLTGSREGLVAVGVMFAYLGVRLRRLLPIGLLAAAALAISFAVPTVWNRFSDPTQGEASGRFAIWNIGMHALKDHWLFGAGIGTFPALYDQHSYAVFDRFFQGWSRPSHDLLIGASVEVGVVGLVLVLVAWFATWRAPMAVPAADPLAPAARGLEAVVVGLFFIALFIDTLWYKYLWLGFALALMVRNAAFLRTPNLLLTKPSNEDPFVRAGTPAVTAYGSGP